MKTADKVLEDFYIASNDEPIGLSGLAVVSKAVVKAKASLYADMLELVGEDEEMPYKDTTFVKEWMGEIENERADGRNAQRAELRKQLAEYYGQEGV